MGAGGEKRLLKNSSFGDERSSNGMIGCHFLAVQDRPSYFQLDDASPLT
jgi:hypothetical protein